MRTALFISLAVLLFITSGRAMDDVEISDECERHFMECPDMDREPSDTAEACAVIMRNKDCLMGKGCTQKDFDTVKEKLCPENSATQGAKYSVLLLATLIIARLFV